MKAFLASIALALFFAVGTAAAGDASQGGDHGNCGHYDKFKDT
jgi:hypothetical protein